MCPDILHGVGIRGQNGRPFFVPLLQITW
jgi:hypothetical protein